MRGQRVIAVDRILSEQLPVGAHGIFLRAADDGHAGLGLVGDDVEIFLHWAEIAVEAHGVLVETDEIEIAMALETRDLLHVRRAALLEVGRIGGFAGLAAQRAVEAEYPAVVEALEGLRVAMLLAANLRAAVRAGVEHCAQGPLGIAREQDAAAADLAGNEIAGLGQLRAVAEIEPAFIEDADTFGLQELGIHKCLARDLEYLLRLIDQERGIHPLERVHCCLPREFLFCHFRAARRS